MARKSKQPRADEAPAAEDASDERQGLLTGESTVDAPEVTDHPPRKKRILAITGAGFIALLLVAYFGPAIARIGMGKKPADPGVDGDLQWNGTHHFKRTVLMVSIDGLRAEYLERGLTPHLLNISKKGLRAKYMQPVFPTLTFPNHWSLMTGLYAESHGIVANNFWDPKSGREFHYNRPDIAMNSSWWHGEPMWETAEHAGIITANLMWPGPETTSSNISATYFQPWRDHVTMDDKLQQLVKWIDLPLQDRPQLILAYEPSLDQAGHATGPNSALVNHTLGQVDLFANSLQLALEARNLTSIVDIIFVSDHGMTDTSHPTFLYMDDPSLLGADGYRAVTHEDGWPAMGLRFRTPEDETKYLAKLLDAANGRYKGKIDVYTKDTMPKRYHFANNERIAPVYVVPKMGYALTTKEENGAGMTKGNHGYDNREPSMHAMFVAHGPFSGAVKHASRGRALKRRSGRIRSDRLPVSPPESESSMSPPGDCDAMEDGACIISGFRNVEIYNLVMNLLGINKDTRAPNNGTVGFWEEYL